MHIKGADSVWADLIERWNQPLAIRRLVHITVQTSSKNDDYVWPSSSETARVQQLQIKSLPPNLNQDDDTLSRDQSGSIWIPAEADDLQLLLCIIARTEPSGHQGLYYTLATLRPQFTSATISSDVSTFLKNCIPCLSKTGEGKVPGPFGTAFQGTDPSDLLRFD